MPSVLRATRTATTAAFAAALFTVLGASGSFAQSNLLVIEQRGEGNTLSSDQSGAENSRVGSLTEPVIQLGNDNQLNIEITGSDTLGPNIVELTTQDNRLATGIADRNTATIVVSSTDGGGTASVEQVPLSGVGGGNVADLTVSGALSTGIISQNGANNTADLTVAGADTAGTLIQNGIGNTGGLLVDGFGTDVTLTQNGNGLNSINAAGLGGNIQGGISVISNGATVIITQTRP